MLELNNIYKNYSAGDMEVPVLKDVSLGVKEKDYLSIMGPSGSGKSTLMNIIGLLDRPTSGTYLFDGIDVSTQNDNKLSRIRNKGIGFVFQNFNLMPRETALANVELPLLYAGVKKKVRKELAAAALERVGLADRMKFFPTQLSGGQKQRVAIARAIVNSPKILLADEPTGALDSHSGDQVMEIFRTLNKEGSTIVMITHEKSVAECADKIVVIYDGVLMSQEEYAQVSSRKHGGDVYEEN
ncbi:MAG: ABC transporter ATP-binding protein [Clostridia bacterium]|nr:ABC transporter ATP-binding protein [Clostridia bacterium]